MTAVFSSSKSQNLPVQNIRGTVTDAVTGHPVTGAYVILKNSQPLKGTTTDEYGRFELRDVTVGRRTIEVSFLGYSSRTASNLMVISGKELVVDISLEEALNTLGEVTVTGTQPSV